MDRYFYRAILQLLKPEHIQEVAILDIHGKGNYEKWKLFFESFGLDIYYIGDFDNVFTLDFLGNKLINREIKNKAEGDIQDIQWSSRWLFTRLCMQKFKEG